MNLDDKYGACLPASKEVREWELDNQPSSLQILDEESAKQLLVYLDQMATLTFAQLTAKTTGILWLMDEAGVVWFAMEEVRRPEDMSMAFVFPRRHLALPSELVKLGHPSLLPKGKAETKTARCGGDIVFDPDLVLESSWIITFQSGRYGLPLRNNLTIDHLRRVAERFSAYGIALSPYID